jgi:hypothetical protein
MVSDPDRELVEAVRARCQMRIGARGTVQVSLRDCGYFIGVGVTVTGAQMRHAVGGRTIEVRDDPDAWADAAAAKLNAWLDRQ